MKMQQETAKVAKAALAVITPTKTVQGALKPHLRIIDDLEAVIVQRGDMIGKAELEIKLLQAKLDDLNHCISLHEKEIAQARSLVTKFSRVMK